jgi:acetyl-CoA carboxylase carboxyltransferase component
MANSTNGKALKAEELVASLAAVDNSSAAKAAAENRLSARQRITAFFDAATFVELGAYVKRAAVCGDASDSDEFEGVICGYGSLDGRLVFAYAQDIDRRKGAFDERQAKKIESLYAMAVKQGAPVVAMLDSAGAAIDEGVMALTAYARVMKCVSDASGIIPQIAYVPGVCAGSMAVISGMYDITVSLKDKSALYVSSPYLTDKKVGTSAFTAENGITALVCDDENSAFASIRRLVNMLPSNNCEGTVLCEGADLNSAFDSASLSDPSATLASLADNSDYVELYELYAPEIKIALAPVGGMVSGIVLNCGKLNANAAKKAAKFISFCDSFGIPVVTLVNCAGIELSSESEEAPAAAELAKLAHAYASSANAKVTVVVGEAYGAGFTLMGSKELGADVAFALDSAKISVLPPETGVAFLWNGKIAESDKDAKSARKELENEWNITVSAPCNAAGCGAIDDIISAVELKQRICAALQMLGAKATDTPTRRHLTMPL